MTLRNYIILPKTLKSLRSNTHALRLKKFETGLCIFKEVPSALPKGLLRLVNLVLSIPSLFLQEMAEKKWGGGIDLPMASPSVIHILSLSLRLANAVVHETPESIF